MPETGNWVWLPDRRSLWMMSLWSIEFTEKDEHYVT